MTQSEHDEAAICLARRQSNRAIVRRNLLGVAASLDEDFLAVIGDGSFVTSRDAYLKLFKQGFDAPRSALTYERIVQRVEIAQIGLLAAEHGQWVATGASGAIAFTGTYFAMWRHTASGWKIRSELFVTLTAGIAKETTASH